VKIVAVSGSLQKGSANAAALRAARALVGAEVEWLLFEGLGTLPHFNPDLERDGPPAEVTAWRLLLAEADAVVIASPEYAFSLPGSLKNALDWVVGSGELYGTPVALLSAGTSGGLHALEALDLTLRTQGAVVVTTLGIAGVRTKMDPGGEIVDPDTLRAVAGAMHTLIERIDGREQTPPWPT
jgi:chromate reductase, NAD(P)H dehydrogenase (quinone)